MIKNNFLKIGLIISICLFPILTYAIKCPTNFNQINVGNTPEQVEKQCGKADKQETKEVKPKAPQEWNYFVNKSFATSNATAQQSTIKVQVVFDADGKVINISVNGLGTGSTTLCGSEIKNGMTEDAIKSACGDPTFINKQQAGEGKPATKVLEWTYNTRPPVKLIFENGEFKEKQ
ncbi:MAG: hypothetical protein A3F12_05640 [Gammaproteobacteria bacterium RIFCSPHIGHO2_12_FULL_38_14]|nr:MAG: hypothetical protein A3F12_05640 [Gammaproteobacteria bacterium RIFCSPHIGHO2_12_FULL_38_14]